MVVQVMLRQHYALYEAVLTGLINEYDHFKFVCDVFSFITGGEIITIRSNPEIEFFESPWRSSYKCNSDSEVNMTSTDKSETGSLLLKELQLQPFMEEKANGKWGEGKIVITTRILICSRLMDLWGVPKI